MHSPGFPCLPAGPGLGGFDPPSLAPPSLYLFPFEFCSQSATNPLKVIADKRISRELPRGVCIVGRDFMDGWWNFKPFDWQDSVELL